MQESLQDINGNKLAPDEVSIKKIFLQAGNSRRYLFSKWRFLLIAAILGGAIGLVYSVLRKTTYTAECTFVLEEGEKGSNGLGQYSALASMVGIDVGGSSSLFQGDNIIQLYKSRLMLQKTLLTPAIFNGKSQLLIDRYIEINKLKDRWKQNPQLANLNFSNEPEKFNISQDSVISLIVADIDKNYLTVDKPDKKLSMISVKVKAADPLFAKAFTETIVANVNTFYVQTKTKGVLQNVVLLQKQADSVHKVLNSAIGRTASALDEDPNPDPAMQSLKVPSQRRQIDVQASSAIYAEVIRNLEIAKGALQRETPLIQVIDQPVLPLLNDRVGKFKSILTGAFAAVLIAAFWIYTMKIYRSIMA